MFYRPWLGSVLCCVVKVLCWKIFLVGQNVLSVESHALENEDYYSQHSDPRVHHL